MTDYQDSKRIVLEFQRELDAALPRDVAAVLARHTAHDYAWRGMHPFYEQTGAEAVAEVFWMPLRRALRPLQRRQDIFMAGTSEAGDKGVWVMSMGHLMGLFDAPWLGIPPTGKLTFLRYCEFNEVRDRRIAQTALFCDIVGVMHQAGLEPLPAQTGAEFVVPGPQTHDGLLFDAQDAAESAQTLELVNRMKDDLVGSYGTEVSPELLARTWHENMLWYGPSGIGSTYTIPRYQAQHQRPFRAGLRDLEFNGHIARFAEGSYAAWFGWPNLSMTPAGGLLGMPACERRVHMRVVDVYRRAGSKLAENWVFIDVLHYLAQQDIDVLARMERIAGYPSSG